jgi:hypothetical protein
MARARRIGPRVLTAAPSMIGCRKENSSATAYPRSFDQLGERRKSRSCKATSWLRLSCRSWRKRPPNCVPHSERNEWRNLLTFSSMGDYLREMTYAVA